VQLSLSEITDVCAFLIKPSQKVIGVCFLTDGVETFVEVFVRVKDKHGTEGRQTTACNWVAEIEAGSITAASDLYVLQVH